MGRYVDLGGGYGWHIESAMRGVTLCGRRFDRGDVIERVDVDTIQARFRETGDKPGYCFDCHSVNNGGTISARRREIHFT